MTAVKELMELNKRTLLVTALLLTLLATATNIHAHGVDASTKNFLTANQGVAIGAFLYIGAKHMVTGYDHLLFLVGVIFFLFRIRDVLVYVSLFTLGHSLTLLFGVLKGIYVNSYLIDAIIGLSIVYKAFDNLGGFKQLFGFQPNNKVAVAIFGLFHGFGLATKLQDFTLPKAHLWKNLLAFNVGVEVGQFIALFFILIVLGFWRQVRQFLRFINHYQYVANDGWAGFGWLPVNWLLHLLLRMNQEQIPVQSVKALINACIVAVFLAVAILFVAVLPAEYGIDPTGIGRRLGLTTLSELSQKTVKPNVENSMITQQTQVGNQDDTAPANQGSDIRPLEINKNIQWKNTVKIVIPPNKGLEYKFALKKGAEFQYSWVSDGTSLYFDFHGEPKGAKDGYFKSYLNIMDSESKGLLTAPFEGIHGWYWENDTSKPVTILLNTNGTYEVLGVMP